jgi:hypothetical protein
MQQTLVGVCGLPSRSIGKNTKEYWTYDEGEAVKVVNFHENQTNAVMHNEFFKISLMNSTYCYVEFQIMHKDLL